MKILEITLVDLLTTYWSQVTLLFFGLGFLIKRSLDLKSKKLEINHTIFQNQRLEAVNSFFENYSKSEIMWNSIAIWDILNHKVSAIELDQLVFPTLNDLKKNGLELKIYIGEGDFKLIDKIIENMSNINEKLSEEYFNFDKDKNVVQKTNDFQSFRDKKLKENKELFNKFIHVIKMTYE